MHEYIVCVWNVQYWLFLKFIKINYKKKREKVIINYQKQYKYIYDKNSKNAYYINKMTQMKVRVRIFQSLDIASPNAVSPLRAFDRSEPFSRTWTKRPIRPVPIDARKLVSRLFVDRACASEDLLLFECRVSFCVHRHH